MTLRHRNSGKCYGSSKFSGKNSLSLLRTSRGQEGNAEENMD